MGPIVVPLDVVEVHRRRDAGLKINIAHETQQRRVIDDAPEIALEVTVVNRVEADQGAEQAQVALHQMFAEEKCGAFQPHRHFIKRQEQVSHRLFIRDLRGREARAIDAVIDVLVEIVADLGLLLRKVQGEQVTCLGAGKAILKHSADVIFGVVDDALLFTIPQYRHRVAAAIAGIGGEIRFAEEMKALRDVTMMSLSLAKRPSALVPHRVGDADAYAVLQFQQGAHDQSPVCPRASERNVKMVASSRHWRSPCFSHDAPESILLSLELPVLRLLGKLGHRHQIAQGSESAPVKIRKRSQHRPLHAAPVKRSRCTLP